MKTTRLLLTALLAAAAATALPAAAQADEGMQSFDPARLAKWAELESLAWPLEVAAADACSNPTWRTGSELLASPDQGLFVRSVAAGSPADGQLQPLDRVVAFNGKKLDGIKGYEKWVGGLREEAAASAEPQRWTVLRDGAELTVSIQPQQACHVDILYADRPGHSFLRREAMIVFTSQLADIAPEPWMVQAQIAHDLGHRLGKHEQQQGRRARFFNVAGNVMAALGGPNITGAGEVLNVARRPEQEVEADRAGIDLAIRIGLSEKDLIQYWVEVIEKQAATGAGATWLSGHPAHGSRIEALQARWEASSATVSTEAQ